MTEAAAGARSLAGAGRTPLREDETRIEAHGAEGGKFMRDCERLGRPVVSRGAALESARQFAARGRVYAFKEGGYLVVSWRKPAKFRERFRVERAEGCAGGGPDHHRRGGAVAWRQG